jgi:hypothetical protein
MTLAIETDPSPAEVQILRCQYNAQCRAQRCPAEATSIARYLDTGGVFLRQFELCEPHTVRLIMRDTARGIVASDYR